MYRPAKQIFGHAGLLILSGLTLVSASAHGQPGYRSMFARAERIYAEECGPVTTNHCKSASDELHLQRVEAYKSARYELAEHIKHSGHSLDEPGMQGLAWELGYDSEKAEERGRAYSYYYACAKVLGATEPAQIPKLLIDGADVSAKEACIQGEWRTLPGSRPPSPPPGPEASNVVDIDFPEPEIFFFGDPKKRGETIKSCKACAEMDPWHLGDLQAPEYKQADDKAKKERKKEETSANPPAIPKKPEPPAGTPGAPATAAVPEPTENQQTSERTEKAPEAAAPEKIQGSRAEDIHAGGQPEEKPQGGQTPEKPSDPASSQKSENPKDEGAQKHEGEDGAGGNGEADTTESGGKKKHHKDPKPPKVHVPHHTKSPE